MSKERKERKPDLARDNYPDIEKRVDRMMNGDSKANQSSADEPIDVSKGVSGKSTTDNFLPSAPDLPMDAKKFDIRVIREGEQTEQTPAVDATAEHLLPEEAGVSATSVNKEEPTAAGAGSKPGFDDESTDKAVKEIISQESDELIQAKDGTSQASQANKQGLLRRFRSGFVAWWRNPLKRRLTLLVLIVAIAVAGIVPSSRYAVLNTFGVRSSTSLIIVDNSSNQPLRNVHVSIGDKTTATNEDGYAELHEVKLGRHDIQIERRAFASRTIGVTLGWGSNPLGDYWLHPTGAQYTFMIKDFLSGAPINKAEVISDDVSAFADEDGLARLTLDIDNDVSELQLEIAAEGYRRETVKLDAAATEQQSVQMVPALKHFFVSERKGGFDVYAADADGQNEAVVLQATGSEREDITMLPHPTKNRVAIISTRDSVRNDDGFLLSTLTVVDVDDEKVVTVAESERLQLVDWYGDRIVFVRIAAGASGTNPARHRLISYDYDRGSDSELASSNYFNSVVSVDGVVYFAPSSIFQTEPSSLYQINADGTDKQTLLDQEAWSLHRVDQDTLVISTSNSWLTYDIPSGETEKLDGEPANLISNLYINNPWLDEVSAWVETRDGAGALLHDSAGDEAVLHETGGLGYPVRWLNETTLVYRVETVGEIADYVISTVGGEPVKLQNVTPTISLERWHYY